MTAIASDKPLAHMFWDGVITTYQKASILSAHNAGFHVIVWSFEKHDLPKEIDQRDAEDILLKNEIEDLEYSGWHSKQSPDHRARALYSDFFRAEVIEKMGGWWFDTDILFFKSASEFEELRNRKIVVGEEPHTYFSVNNAVLSFGDKKYATVYKRYLYALGRNGGSHKWGTFGPGALNKIFNILDLKHDVMPQHSFYPVSVGARKHLYSPSRLSIKLCDESVTDSYCLHWWNSSEYNKKSGFSEKPPVGSFLGKEFNKVFETFERNRLSK
jgi:hypothetical protein